MSCGSTGPGLRILGLPFEISKTVDSIPSLQLPPSSTLGQSDLKLSKTCWAVVGLNLFVGLALGAAKGRLVFLSTFLKTSLSGERSATVFNPPVVIFGTISLLSRMNVSGPGQNFSAREKKYSFVTAKDHSCMFNMCTIRGFCAGRPGLVNFLPWLDTKHSLPIRKRFQCV